MILNLQTAEISVLLLHMAMARKNVRNVFKKNKNGKELLASFDEVKNELELIISDTGEDEGHVRKEIYFNIKEISLLQSFLANYIPLLSDTLKKAGNVLKEDEKQVEVLQMIENKTKKMVEGAASA